jgi:hypothetical protein
VGTTEQVVKNYLRKVYDKLGRGRSIRTGALLPEPSRCRRREATSYPDIRFGWAKQWCPGSQWSRSGCFSERIFFDCYKSSVCDPRHRFSGQAELSKPLLTGSHRRSKFAEAEFARMHSCPIE